MRHAAVGHLTAALLGVASLLAAPAAAQLAFAPCAEPGHEAFDCATLPVPLDRSGAVPGTVALHVERLRVAEPPARVLIPLAGGPGQSASSLAESFREEFKGAGVLDGYQLVVFDQRGTGLSGALTCPSRGGARRCAATLGDARAFYTTADSVADLDALQEALGVDGIALFGVSYGTWVAMEYARAHPDRLSHVVLDSPLPPGGGLPLEVPSVAAVPRVLGEDLCGREACTGVTTDAVRDLRKLVRRLRDTPIRGSFLATSGRRQRVTVSEGSLMELLEAGDLETELRALFPAAVAAALARDGRPLVRLRALASGGGDAVAPRGAEDDDTRENSTALFIATTCTDIVFPWPGDATVRARRRAAAQALRGVPRPALVPFGPAALPGVSPIRGCLGWPDTSLARARIGGPLPQSVPTLILQGDGDLRTPLSDALEIVAQLPIAQLVRVPRRTHAVAGTGCASKELARFLTTDQAVDPAACADNPAEFPVEPVPPLHVAAILLPLDVPATRGGRTLAAILRTVEDLRLATLSFRGTLGATVGGLRGGRAVIDGDQIRLRSYAYVPGIALDGTYAPSLPSLDVDVGGRHAAGGTVTMTPDGLIHAQLGGETIEIDRRTTAVGQALPRARPVIR